MGKDEDFSSGHGKSSPGAEFIDSNTSSFLAPNKAYVNNKRKRSSPVTVPVALSMYDNELHSHASKKETSRLYKAVPEDHEIVESGILHTTKSGQEGRLQHIEVETKRGDQDNKASAGHDTYSPGRNCEGKGSYQYQQKRLISRSHPMFNNSDRAGGIIPPKSPLHLDETTTEIQESAHSLSEPPQQNRITLTTGDAQGSMNHRLSLLSTRERQVYQQQPPQWKQSIAGDLTSSSSLGLDLGSIRASQQYAEALDNVRVRSVIGGGLCPPSRSFSAFRQHPYIDWRGLQMEVAARQGSTALPLLFGTHPGLLRDNIMIDSLRTVPMNSSVGFDNYLDDSGYNPRAPRVDGFMSAVLRRPSVSIEREERDRNFLLHRDELLRSYPLLIAGGRWRENFNSIGLIGGTSMGSLNDMNTSVTGQDRLLGTSLHEVLSRETQGSTGPLPSSTLTDGGTTDDIFDVLSSKGQTRNTYQSREDMNVLDEKNSPTSAHLAVEDNADDRLVHTSNLSDDLGNRSILSTDQRSRVLYVEGDEHYLTAYQCLLRKQLEVFEAGPHDIRGSTQGRNVPILLGQVGLRCRHCANLPLAARTKGAVYYSQTIEGMYQIAQNMSKVHLCQRCYRIPPNVQNKLISLKNDCRRATGGKEYWTKALITMGVYEDGTVLRLMKNPPKPRQSTT